MKRVMSFIKNRYVRYLLILLATIIGLFIVQISLLAFPQIMLTDSVTAGTITIHYDSSSGLNIGQLVSDVEDRLKGMPLYDSTRSDRVFLFDSPKLYSFFCRLTLLDHIPQGYNLSILGNTFVSVTANRSLGQRTGGKPEFSIWDGEIAHLIAHEVGHQYIVDRIGRQPLPHWKQEGLPEYMANQSSVKSVGSSLSDRIKVLHDDNAWNATLGWSRHGWDRKHYEAWLLVEYLISIERKTVEDIISANVVRADVFSRMMNWYNTNKPATKSNES